MEKCSPVRCNRELSPWRDEIYHLLKRRCGALNVKLSLCLWPWGICDDWESRFRLIQHWAISWVMLFKCYSSLTGFRAKETLLKSQTPDVSYWQWRWFVWHWDIFVLLWNSTSFIERVQAVWITCNPWSISSEGAHIKKSSWFSLLTRCSPH